ncbi:MAG: peptide chain release factor-like protein [Phycisphaerales bacterium]
MSRRLYDVPQERSGWYAHPAAWPDEELLKVCTITRGRTSGPGGQHRNRVETQAIITHDETGIVGQAGERREANVNMRVALRRLRLALATEHRLPVPTGEIGSELWKSRLQRIREKDGTVRTRLVINPEHRDYPSLLAEALDVIDACGHDMKRAGLRLETSIAQLIKLIREHKAALAWLNAEREKRGMPTVR